MKNITFAVVLGTIVIGVDSSPGASLSEFQHDFSGSFFFSYTRAGSGGRSSGYGSVMTFAVTPTYLKKVAGFVQVGPQLTFQYSRQAYNDGFSTYGGGYYALGIGPKVEVNFMKKTPATPYFGFGAVVSGVREFDFTPTTTKYGDLGLSVSVPVEFGGKIFAGRSSAVRISVAVAPTLPLAGVGAVSVGASDNIALSVFIGVGLSHMFE